MTFSIKKRIVVFFFLFSLHGMVSAQETEPLTDPEIQETLLFETVDGLETWHHEIDINDYAPGKYNIIIEGVDRAGNKYTEGPYDIIIDPDSDKPQINISNPLPAMKVNGNINIIGTCLDDDSVAYVELKINDGEFLRTEGTEFWSYFLNTRSMKDGLCTVTARGVDSNGLEGDVFTVEFILDRSVPVNEITSHVNGSFVFGKIQLEGRIEDSNGIEKLEISLDGGETYKEISVKTSKKVPFSEFKYSLDTRKLEDGPLVIWLKSEDKTGSIGLTSFLFYVDNRPPILNIIYPLVDPLEGDRVNGKFTVVGTAFDDIGIASLTYRKGRDELVNIPLTPGDLYWYSELDFTGENKGDVTFYLSDKTGNVGETRLQISLDTEGDKPVIDLISPLENETYLKLALSGFVSDDDHVKEIIYSLDGGEPIIVPAEYAFNIELKGLNPGNHKMEIHALDINGVSSDIRKIAFLTSGEAPEISLNSLTPVEGDSSTPFEQAIVVDGAAYKNLIGSVHFFNEAESLSYSLDGGEEKKLTPGKDDGTGKRPFSLPLKELIPGVRTLTFKALDKRDLLTEKSFYLVISHPEEGAGSGKIYYADHRFTADGKPKNGLLKLNTNDRIVFYLEGDTITEAAFTEEQDFLELEKSNDRVILSSMDDGFKEGVIFEVKTSKGKTLSLGPFSIAADTILPGILLKEPPAPIAGTDPYLISGEVSDNVGLKDFSYSLNGESFLPISVEEGQFSQSLDLENSADGGIRLTLRAVDQAGNIREDHYLIWKDTSAPFLNQIAPLSKKGVNGSVTFIGKLEDATSISSVEYAPDGVNFILLENRNFPVGKIDLTLGNEASLPFNPVFRITDRAGNVSLNEPKILIDEEGDKPVVEIQIPLEKTLIQSDFVVSGIVLDDDGVQSLYYRIDGGEYIELDGGDSFIIPLTLSDFSDNSHVLDVKAVDVNGVESDAASLLFNVSKEEPHSEIHKPSMGSSVKGRIEIEGVSDDANGISDVLLSYDNGITFNRMEMVPLDLSEELPGEEDSSLPEPTAVGWTYHLNSELLEDGSYSLLIKGIDSYGVSNLYTSLITIDNTSPDLELSEPADGSQFSGPLRLKGFLKDNNKISRVSVDVSHLSQGEKSFTAELSQENILLEELELDDFPPGWINVRITVQDEMGNTSQISRNIRKTDGFSNKRVLLLTPIKGSDITGSLAVQGRVENMDSVESVTLYLDEQSRGNLKVNNLGYFNTLLEGEELSDGEHTLYVLVDDGQNPPVQSDIFDFRYSRLGPWVRINSLSAGDFVSSRPWVEGTAGYEYILPELDKKSSEAFQKERSIEKVEVSLDNGKTFRAATGKEAWKFRLETYELPAGEVWILVRARYKDGTAATVRTLVIVDESAPRVELLYPGEGMRFNGRITMDGTAYDENGLEKVSAALREGDKNKYQVPSFIQGLYFDLHFLGANYAEAGLGLTFFDDNVKLQTQVGLAPPGRFTGLTLGLKLLANVAVLPWDYFLGYDFEDFSSTLAVGTTFNYFTMSEDNLFSDEGLVLGALLGQAELIKMNIPEWDMFSSFSLYAEIQLWVISSDVNAGVEPRFSFGIRSDIF